MYCWGTSTIGVASPSVDPEEGVLVKVWTDSLTCSGAGVTVGGGGGGGSAQVMIPLQMQDSQNRTLLLQMRVKRCYGKALKVRT